MTNTHNNPLNEMVMMVRRFIAALLQNAAIQQAKRIPPS
jgi:hypothetical protein